jgi:ABC-type multidrug transport system ATPase subunit
VPSSTRSPRHDPPRTARGRHPRRAPLQAEQAAILEVSGVTARTAGGRTLLDDVSFAVQRGWLVAIVGPTGAGKTSLARALTGNLALAAGSIRLDGADLTGEGGEALDRIAYVPQDDVLHGQLGLERTLQYAASLRVSPSMGEGERRRRVEAALRELGLQGQAGVAIRSLSGGQRKRANIAAELVGHPEVLVLDEPTSGHDPGYEKAVMRSLRELADGGRTVITVTHSMQALDQCDRVLFLAEGGRMAYFGPPSRAADYFGQGDAADVFLALDTEPGEAWKARFQAHPAYARYVSPVLAAAGRGRERTTERDGSAALARRVRPSWPAQVGILVRRHLALLRSDRRHLGLLLAQGPVLGLLLWLVLRPDSLVPQLGLRGLSPTAETVAMFVALSATWLGASNAVREIVKERHIVRREVDAGLAPSAYVVAKALVLGCTTVLQTTILTLVACAGQHPPAAGALGASRVELAVAGALAGLAATALGLCLSSLSTSPDRALALLPMTLVTELALAGHWTANVRSPGLTLLRDLTGAHWGVAAVGATVSGSTRDWLGAVAVLGAPTAAALLGTIALVRHHTRAAVARPSSAGARLGALEAVARERGRPIVGVAALGVLAVSVCIAAAGTGHGPVTPHDPVVAAPATPAASTPAALAPAAAPTTAPAPVVVPATTLTAAHPVRTVADPTTTTTVPYVSPTTVPATTPTTYVTPTTTKPAAPTGGVTAASTTSAPWWSPWFWMSWMASGGK